MIHRECDSLELANIEIEKLTNSGWTIIGIDHWQGKYVVDYTSESAFKSETMNQEGGTHFGVIAARPDSAEILKADIKKVRQTTLEY